jgi:hypothetical protein
MEGAEAALKATMEAGGMASEHVNAAESAAATWVQAATQPVLRIQAVWGGGRRTLEGSKMAWVQASMGLARAAVEVVVGLVAGAEAKVSGMAAEVMGTTEAVTIV